MNQIITTTTVKKNNSRQTLFLQFFKNEFNINEFSPMKYLNICILIKLHKIHYNKSVNQSFNIQEVY